MQLNYVSLIFLGVCIGSSIVMLRLVCVWDMVSVLAKPETKWRFRFFLQLWHFADLFVKQLSDSNIWIKKKKLYACLR